MKTTITLLSIVALVGTPSVFAQVPTFTVDNNTDCTFDIELEWMLPPPSACSQTCNLSTYNNCSGTGCVITISCTGATPASAYGYRIRVRENGSSTWSAWFVNPGCTGSNSGSAAGTECPTANVTMHSNTYATIDP